MKVLMILVALLCNFLFIQQSGFAENESLPAKPESPKNEELQPQKQQIKERKFSSRVEVIVSAPESIKDQVTSYVNRELRSLGDVVITDKNPQYRLRIDAREITESPSKSVIGIAFAVVITKRLSWEDFVSYHPTFKREGDIIAIQLFFSDSAEQVEAYSVMIGSQDKFREICESFVASFDTNWLEKDRDKWQGSMEEEAKYPLVAAADRGDYDAVAALLEEGVDPNQRANRGKTALMEAAYSGYMFMVELLIEKGANVNAQSEYGTALTLAVSGGWEYTVEFLLGEGADPNYKDKWGDTVLEGALRRDRHSIIQLLKKAGAKEEKASEKRDPSVNDY